MSERTASLRARRDQLKSEVEALRQNKGLSPSSAESSFDWKKTAKDFGHASAKTARNIAAGAADTYDFIASPLTAPYNLAAKALGAPEKYHMKPLAPQITNAIDTATGGYTAPQNDEDRVIESVTRGLTTIPGVGTAAKGAQWAAKGLKGATAKGLPKFLAGMGEATPINAASTAGSAALSQQALNQDPNSPLSALGWGLVGGLTPQAGRFATQAGRNFTKQKTGERLSSLTKFDPEAYASFEKAGIAPELANVVESKITKGMSDWMSKIPWAGEKLAQRKHDQYKEALELLDQGSSLSRGKASKLALEGAKAHQASKDTIHSQIFNKIESDIGKMPDLSIRPTHSHNFQAELIKNKKTPYAIEKFKSSPVGEFSTELSSIIQQGSDYHDLKGLIERINDATTTHGLIGKQSQSKLKKLAQSIGKDIDEGMTPKFTELGNESLHNWKKGNALYADYAQNEIPFLNQIYKKDKAGATDVFMDLLTNVKKGGEKAKLALEGLPSHDRQSLMKEVNNRLGMHGKGDFSLTVWAKNFKDLEPEMQNLLFGHYTGAQQKKVHALVDAISHMKATTAEANASRSGITVGQMAMAAEAVRSLGHLSYGNPMPIIKDIMALGAARMGSNMFTNPKIMNWMYESTKAPNVATLAKRIENGKKMKGLPQAFSHTLQEAERIIKRAPENKRNDRIAYRDQLRKEIENMKRDRQSD